MKNKIKIKIKLHIPCHARWFQMFNEQCSACIVAYHRLNQLSLKHFHGTHWILNTPIAKNYMVSYQDISEITSRETTSWLLNLLQNAFLYVVVLFAHCRSELHCPNIFAEGLCSLPFRNYEKLQQVKISFYRNGNVTAFFA